MTGERPADWTDGTARLVLAVCDTCGHSWYLPRMNCPRCGSADQSAVDAAGSGLCVAVTRLPVSSGSSVPTVGLGLAELDEGPLVMGRVYDQLAPGDRIQIEFRLDGPDRAMVPSFTRKATG